MKPTAAMPKDEREVGAVISHYISMSTVRSFAGGLRVQTWCRVRKTNCTMCQRLLAFVFVDLNVLFAAYYVYFVGLLSGASLRLPQPSSDWPASAVELPPGEDDPPVEHVPAAAPRELTRSRRRAASSPPGEIPRRVLTGGLPLASVG
jgi:hypothetical protein